MSDANGRDESALSDTETFVIAGTSLIHSRLSCFRTQDAQRLNRPKQQYTCKDQRQHQPPSAAAPSASQKQWPSTSVPLVAFRLLTPLNDPINSSKTQLKHEPFEIKDQTSDRRKRARLVSSRLQLPFAAEPHFQEMSKCNHFLQNVATRVNIFK
jgi:hypothetical protein